MITVMGVATSCAQETTKKSTTAKMAKVDGAGMDGFVSETIDYGTIAHNADGQRICFTNNGTKPLSQILKVHAVVLYFLKKQLLQGKRYYWCKICY
jgi:hypothetical protein